MSKNDRADLIELVRIYETNQSPCFAMVEACWHGLKSEVERLHSGGVSVNCQTNDGYTPLMKAIIASLPISRLLVRLGADVNAVTPDNETALVILLRTAVDRTWPAKIRLLLESGADTSIIASNGESPLSIIERKQRERTPPKIVSEVIDLLKRDE